MLPFILESRLTKDAILVIHQQLQKSLSLALNGLGYSSNQKRDVHAGISAHFLIQVIFHLCSGELRKIR